jgi:hypothetical protein
MISLLEIGTDVEKVDLQRPVAQMQHNGRLGAEPGVQTGQPGQFVALPDGNVGARLDQVLVHVRAEVLEQCDLLFQRRRVLLRCVIVLHVVAFRVLELAKRKGFLIWMNI